MVIFGFCKDWAVEKCTDPVFKMFWKPRNEQDKSDFFFKRPVWRRDDTSISDELFQWKYLIFQLVYQLVIITNY